MPRSSWGVRRAWTASRPWPTCSTAGFELERALDVTAQALAGRGARARLIGSWRAALPAGRFPETMAASVPAAEAMIFEAYGRVEAGRLFAAAARVAELRERQMAAVRKALAMPLLLGRRSRHHAVGRRRLVRAGAGGRGAARALGAGRQRVFRAASSWLFAHPLGFALLCAAVAAPVGAAMVFWTGPGRTALDRIAPFSLYRTVTGSAFLFVVLEFLGAGLDLNDRAFEDLKRRAGAYARHRIAAIQRHMARGAGSGARHDARGPRLPRPRAGAGGRRARRRARLGGQAVCASSPAGWTAPKTS